MSKVDRALAAYLVSEGAGTANDTHPVVKARVVPVQDFNANQLRTQDPNGKEGEDRPRVVVSFAKQADHLLLSGMLDNGDELAGKPVVVDAPRGRGVPSIEGVLLNYITEDITRIHA